MRTAGTFTQPGEEVGNSGGRVFGNEVTRPFVPMNVGMGHSLEQIGQIQIAEDRILGSP